MMADLSILFGLGEGSFGKLIILGVFTICAYFFFGRKSKIDKALEHVPSPSSLPFIGTMHHLTFLEKEDIFKVFQKFEDQFGAVFQMSFGRERIIILTDPDVIERLLSSSVHIKKGLDYEKHVKPWLGDGLLISAGSKWGVRRKMLTPAFHFRILEDFVEVFDRNSRKLVSIMEDKIGYKNVVDIFPFVSRCGLDIICETAMGVETNYQEDIDNEYLQAVMGISDIIQKRTVKPWLGIDCIWKWTKEYVLHEKYLKILHTFTEKIIEQKKNDYTQSVSSSSRDENDKNFGPSGKKRLAFLDLLLEEQRQNSSLSDLDIREETDTFMFEGHDTTSTSVAFTIFCIASSPLVQEKVQQELDEIFDHSMREIHSGDLYKMKYLECCIKESLRLCPSVPIIERRLESDFKIDDKTTLPAGVDILIDIYRLHRNKKIHKDADLFIPERFMQGSEGMNQKHFSYIPFSAGPRNCIGQRFAMLESKVMIANFFRNFCAYTIEDFSELRLFPEIILRNRGGVRVGLQSLDCRGKTSQTSN